MIRFASLAFAAAALLGVAGCGEDGRNEAPPIRPVLSVVVEPSNQRRIGFAGTIEPRYQTDRAFQVLGRIISRDVDVGDVVKRGQTIAKNDPLAYRLALRTSEAELASARSQLEKTTAQRERTSTLVRQKVSPQADLDSSQQAMDAAAASVQQAEANVRKATEQLSYTTMTADLDGVVTSVNAQVGQMASPGVKVMTLARTDVREAVVDLPEDVVRSIGVGVPFDVRLQADTSIEMKGKVREIAPEADATTRLRRVRITLDRSVDPFRLGATITATPLVAAGRSTIDLPSAAVFERDGGTRVWIVDQAAKTVRSAPVEVAERDGGMIRIASGLGAGTRVVIAGVNSLAEGRSVKVEGPQP